MSILLAIGEPAFTQILRSNLTEAGLDVSDNDVFHRNYLNEIIELENPSMVLIHDTYLPSDTTSQKENEEEMLRLIEYWRTTYDNKLRVVYLCERDRRDPFLGDLVARNVLDIFNERMISTASFQAQLSAEPRFANVAKFGIGALEVEFEEEPSEDLEEEELEAIQQPIQKGDAEESSDVKGEKARQLLTQITGKAKSVMEAGAEWNQQRAKEREERQAATPLINPDQVDDYIDLMPIPKEVYARNQVIGTVVIAVASAKPHLGATHTSMAIAAYLSKQGHSVALIESNYSEDFDKIHALYEGEKQYIRNETKFEYAGIEHYKYREDLRLGEIMPVYEYVVLDIGCVEDTPHYDEFLRSHVRVLIVSPYEWKQHWIDNFRKTVSDPDFFIYLAPFAERANVQDMEERFPDIHIEAFPSLSNPYKVSQEAEAIIENMLQGYLKESSLRMSKKGIFIASIASAAATAGIICAFAFL